jgi:hypothetical protein
MHDRSIEAVDRDLAVERGILAHEIRAGRLSSGCVATWRHIDSLLDERLVLMLPVVPGLPDAAPAAVDGPMVQG